MITVLADLINQFICWINSKRKLSAGAVTGLYFIVGTILMIVIPAKIFILVEGKIGNIK